MPTDSSVQFHTIEALEAMSDEALAALGELVPTERQRQYRAMYDKELKNEGVSESVGSDSLEKQVLLSLLRQYQEDNLVPANDVWANAPKHIRDRANSNEEALDAEPD